jgi:hypothetical protein
MSDPVDRPDCHGCAAQLGDTAGGEAVPDAALVGRIELVETADQAQGLITPPLAA